MKVREMLHSLAAVAACTNKLKFIVGNTFNTAPQRL